MHPQHHVRLRLGLREGKDKGCCIQDSDRIFAVDGLQRLQLISLLLQVVLCSRVGRGQAGAGSEAGAGGGGRLWQLGMLQPCCVAILCRCALWRK